jgi:hypothetical protein
LTIDNAGRVNEDEFRMRNAHFDEVLRQLGEAFAKESSNISKSYEKSSMAMKKLDFSMLLTLKE